MDAIHANNIAAAIARRQLSGEDAKSLLSPDILIDPFDSISHDDNKQMKLQKRLSSSKNGTHNEDNVAALLRSIEESTTDNSISSHSTNRKKKKQNISNHLVKHRKELIELQRDREKRMLEEKCKEEAKSLQRDIQKRKSFAHVKSKVFDATECSHHSSSENLADKVVIKRDELLGVDSMANSCMESLAPSSVSTMTDDTCLRRYSNITKQSTLGSSKAKNSFSKHQNYGRVPDYILQRRIEEEMNRGKENIENDPLKNVDKVDKEPELYSMSSKRMTQKLKCERLQQLQDDETVVRSEMMKLPFVLTSEGSRMKRASLEKQLKQIEEERKQISPINKVGNIFK